MPRYYLHIQDACEEIRDPDGEVIENLILAIEEAKAVARDLMAERLQSGGGLGLGRRVIVEDENAAVLAAVPFREALSDD